MTVRQAVWSWSAKARHHLFPQGRWEDREDGGRRLSRRQTRDRDALQDQAVRGSRLGHYRVVRGEFRFQFTQVYSLLSLNLKTYIV